MNKVNSPDRDKPVASPCISVCALDDKDICTGCFRTLKEIGDWSLMSNDQRRQVVVAAHQRSKARFGLG